MDASWLGTDLEAVGRSHAIAAAVPDHLATVRANTETRVARVRAAVWDRLSREIDHWDRRADELRLQAAAGRQPRMNPDRAAARAEELTRRRDAPMRSLDQEANLKPLPPVVVGGALVVPVGLVVPPHASAETPPPPARAIDTAEVARRPRCRDQSGRRR